MVPLLHKVDEDDVSDEHSFNPLVVAVLSECVDSCRSLLAEFGRISGWNVVFSLFTEFGRAMR